MVGPPNNKLFNYVGNNNPAIRATPKVENFVFYRNSLKCVNCGELWKTDRFALHQKPASVLPCKCIVFCYTQLYEYSQTHRGLSCHTSRRHGVVVVRFILGSRIGGMVPPDKLATRIIARVLAQ